MRLEIVLFTLLSAVSALQCGKHDILKKYNLDKHYILYSRETDTPPSKTTEEWWLNVCEENKNASNRPHGCKEDDILCGLSIVKLPETGELVTQLLEFSKKIGYSVEEDLENNVLILNLESTKWGSHSIDAQIEFTCDDNMKLDEVTMSTWQDQQVQLLIKGPSGCLKDKSDKNPGNNDDDNGENNTQPKKPGEKSQSFSWFTWLFVYAIIFTLIYLAITSYTNTRGGSLQEFRDDFIERSTQLVTSLPAFIKEVISKIMGQSSSSQRGGYSAV